MALRVGIDLASVDAVRESIRAHAERYLERVYTEGELRECQTAAGLDPERLAARFAVKEAAMKVLRPSDTAAVPWRTIGVRRGPSGSVELELSGPAAVLADEIGITELAVSLTHEADFAAAVVVAEL
jgi:holo-[acyl-carrier protein] synthase